MVKRLLAMQGSGVRFSLCAPSVCMKIVSEKELFMVNTMTYMLELLDVVTLNARADLSLNLRNKYLGGRF